MLRWDCVCHSTVITGKKLYHAITWALWIPQKSFIFQKFPLKTNKNNMCFKDLSFLFTWYFVKNQTNSEMAKKLAKHDFSLLKPPPPQLFFFKDPSKLKYLSYFQFFHMGSCLSSSSHRCSHVSPSDFSSFGTQSVPKR